MQVQAGTLFPELAAFERSIKRAGQGAGKSIPSDPFKQ